MWSQNIAWKWAELGLCCSVFTHEFWMHFVFATHCIKSLFIIPSGRLVSYIVCGNRFLRVPQVEQLAVACVRRKTKQTKQICHYVLLTKRDTSEICSMSTHVSESEIWNTELFISYTDIFACFWVIWYEVLSVVYSRDGVMVLHNCHSLSCKFTETMAKFRILHCTLWIHSVN